MEAQRAIVMVDWK